MPYRRRLDGWTAGVANLLASAYGVTAPVAHQMLTIAKHHHQQRTSHYGQLGAPLTNYKQQRLRTKVYDKIKPVSKASVAKNPKNKILTNVKAMPYRRKSTFKRRSRPRRRRFARKLPPLALPRSKVVRMRAVFTSSFSSTGGTLAGQLLKANSLNDPGSGLTAILPLGTDQWASQYKKYIVLGSKLTIRSSPTANTGPGVIGIHLTDSGSLLASTSHYKMLPKTTQCILTTQKDLAKCSMKYSGKKFWHLTNIKDDAEQEGTFSTSPGSPVDECYYHVYIQDMVGTSTFTCDVQFEMEFIVLLTNPVTLEESSL